MVKDTKERLENSKQDTYNGTEGVTFMHVSGFGKTQKNYKDDDHPKLLHLPLADESPILTHIELETSHSIYDNNLYVDGVGFLISDKDLIKVTSTSRVHHPMKRIKRLCTACSRPITKFPFYQLPGGDDSRYDVVFHDLCFRLPKQVRNHAGHPHDDHTLELDNSTDLLRKVCYFCKLPFNGFSYHCSEWSCGYKIDVNCAFIPEEITHEAHADHLLTRVDDASSLSRSRTECRTCRVGIYGREIYFRCNACDFYLDCRCALHLPKSVRNKCDKHPLQLSYSPIEDYKSQYFCEVCEEDLDPGKWFYHCVECAQSIHSACAPLILQSEQGVNSLHVEGVFKFINILFGFRLKLPYHQHPVSLAPGTENDGLCPICRSSMQSNIIWRCLDCSFAKHHTCLVREHGATVTPIDEFGGTKRMIQHQPKRNTKFYPTHIMKRPVTRHYEVIDQDI